MITKPVKVSCPRDDEIIIGIQMENNHRQFVFDCSVFDEEVSSIMLVHQRSKDVAPYIAATSSTDTLVWTVTNTDTTYSGYGKAELRVSFANGLAKSETYITKVLESITGDTVIPDPLQSWYDALIDYIDDHAASPEQIEAAVEAYLEEHPIPAPVTSVNGKLGDVVLSAADVGAVASETDPVFVASPAYGITSADITGWNAKSDFSGSYNDLTDKPTIPTTVSELENDAGYITSAPVDSVNGKTGVVVLSASDVGAYVKPSGGIPKSDLASTVQASLGLADTALQSAPVTSVNSKTGAVTLTANDVGALPASYVAPVTSVDGKTGDVQIMPSGGTAGQVLTKTASGAEWADKYPSSGTAGQVLTKTATGEAWDDVDGLPAGGTTGQVLTKNSSTDGDASWQTPQNDGIWGSITGTLSDQTDLQNALNAKANTSTLATVESASTASQAYAEGDYLVLNGQLYKVTADVASGETLVIGTNIEATTAGAELKALNKDLESHYMNYETLENEYVTVNPSIVNTSEYYKVEIWSRNTEAFMQVSFKLKTAVSNNSSQTVLNFTSKITELLSATYRTFSGFIESGTYAGRNCVLHLDTWNDTKKLEMYNTLGGSIPVGSQMTFSFYVMK